MRIVLALVVIAACGGSPTPLPKGPPPEYEQEPAIVGSESADAATPPQSSPINAK